MWLIYFCNLTNVNKLDKFQYQMFYKLWHVRYCACVEYKLYEDDSK